MSHTQAAYDGLFSSIASRLRSEGWETRQEYPPGAYLHVSRPSWRDTNMNGIHLEAYVLGNQIRAGEAVVALHCERGWPTQFREKFMKNMTERARPTIERWNREEGKLGIWEVKGPKGMSVCESLVPFGSNPGETMVRVETQLGRLQTIAGLVDEVIEDCLQELSDETAGKGKVSRLISKQDVARNDGKGGRSLWVVIDGYVVDATDFAAGGHPGGLRKILSTNDATTGWTGKAFGFSLSRGPNAHFPQTGKTFQEGVAKFEKLDRKEPVDVTYPSYGTISILGKLA